jgi:hypothetical protein
LPSRSPTSLPARRADRRRARLERTRLRYLQLQIARLERSSAAEVQAKQRSEVRSTVGQLVVWLLLLAVYSLVLGLASSSLVVLSLANPAELARNAALVSAYAGQAVQFLPEALRGIAVSALSAGALLVFRAASFSVRSDIGGALFVGVAIVSLVGFSAAAYSGIVGFMAALPGFVAATFVVYELLRSLRRIHGTVTPGSGRAPHAPVRRLPLAALGRLLVRADPARRPALALVFLSLPWICLALVAASFVTHGGALFWPSRIAMFTFGGWCVWACAATPGVVRIPLWATILWGALLSPQLAANPVVYLFVIAAIGLLFVNLVLAVWGRDRAAADVGLGQAPT